MARGKTAKTTQIRQYIIDQVEEHPQELTRLVATQFQITRQAAHQHVNRLVKEGLLAAHGKARSRRYELLPYVDRIFQFPVAGELQEDLVWLQHVRPFLESLSDNVLRICEYGFTEMLNNVVDHSEGTTTTIHVYYTVKLVRLIVADNGVGIFRKIQSALNLADPRQALLELAKGKFTTDPARHTGEGIFFTSRAFDRFMIDSHGVIFLHGAAKDDWLLDSPDAAEDTAPDISTYIEMTISASSNRDLSAVFDRYASAEGDYGFTKTVVPVTMARLGNENLVSRSQAKRLLARVERFKEVILDFAKVDTVGQAFADEIFRIYRLQHPDVNIVPIHATEDVMKMILRALTRPADE